MAFVYLCDITTGDGNVYRKLGWTKSPKMRIESYRRFGATVELLDCRELDDAKYCEQTLLDFFRMCGFQIDAPAWIGKTECFSQDAPTQLPRGRKIEEHQLTNEYERIIFSARARIIQRFDKLASQDGLSRSSFFYKIVQEEYQRRYDF